MSFSNIISVGTFVLSGSESSTAWLRNPSVCTVGKFLSHAFAEITNNLNRHNDFHFNRCWSSRFCSYLVSLPLLCRRKVSNTFWSRDPQTSDTSLLMKGLLFSEPFAESLQNSPRNAETSGSRSTSKKYFRCMFWLCLHHIPSSTHHSPHCIVFTGKRDGCMSQ